MNSEEYANLAAIERFHWYYVGKREVVRRCLKRMAPEAAGQTLLDCGAGTGLFAEEMSARYRVLVLDDHDESLVRLRTRFAPDQVLRVSADGIPLPARSVDVVTMLDVLEHVERDTAVVDEVERILRPGGTAIVTVPAGMALWSDWDVGLHHFRRYDRAGLCALFSGEGWEIVHVNYTNVLIYPAVWLLRRGRGLFRSQRGPGAIRSEDRMPARWLNALLRSVFVGMALWRFPLPFGVSLVLVARRRG